MPKFRISIPVKIGVLLFIGLTVIFAGGFLSYKSLVKVVDTIHQEKAAKTGLPAIRYLTTSMEQAENYIRLYGITRDRSYLQDYTQLTGKIDSNINVLYTHYPEDSWFTTKIDTINMLFEQKKQLWREMSDIWERGATSRTISSITDEIQSEETVPDSSRRIIDRLLFNKRERQTISDAKILEILTELERDERQFESSLTEHEIRLALTSNLLFDAFISLLTQLEEYELTLELQNQQDVDELANEAYKLMTAFFVFGVFLGLFGLFILVQYIRKNQAYNKILIQSRRDAEDLARSKERFMANVSHEIRTPLNAITGFIKQILYSPIDRELKARLKIVDAAGDQLIRLINDVLDFSKLQSGNLALNNIHFRPKVLISDGCMIFSEMADKNGNVISQDTDQLQGLALFGDTHRFQQILYNLLNNAVKFTRNGTVEVHASTRDLNAHELQMHLVIKDNGLGIESSKLDKIFEEYSQANNDISIRYGGTGLGLSIVKKLVELFNGDIHIESRKGVGTTVTCNLVFTKGDPELITETREDPVKYQLPEGLRMLVADDEPYNQDLIAMILKKWNVSFDLAKNGLEAIELFKKKPYDIVLMDVRMPVIDGIMATRFIRETLGHSKQEVVVIGITADISRHADENLDELFNHILVKPFLEEELHGAITGWEANTADSGRKGSAENEPGTETGERAGSGMSEASKYAEKEADLSGLLRDSGNDPVFVREMIDRFRESTLKGLGEIRTELKKEHYSAVGDLAHQLAPASRHLKITRLLEKLKEIEKYADNKNGGEIVILLDEAEELTNRAVQRLNEQYEQRIG
jgi:signal transduction histidine kinase/CheY-like chemotaxis protein